MWQQVDDFISGALPISQYMSTFGPDHATDIIENMVGKLGKPFFINTYNRGAVNNMPDDAFLELLCDVDMDGPVRAQSARCRVVFGACKNRFSTPTN